jgi:predicted ribosomally synthesized peptide with nif11-like leader
VLRDADRKVVAGLNKEYHLPLLAMSEEQLAALLAKLKDDAGLQEKLKGAADLDAALAMAKEAGFDVSKADWLRYQAKQTLELNDEELEGVAGGWWLGEGGRCYFVSEQRLLR